MWSPSGGQVNRGAVRSAPFPQHTLKCMCIHTDIHKQRLTPVNGLNSLKTYGLRLQYTFVTPSPRLAPSAVSLL